MLQIALAGLVLNKVLTLKEAEAIDIKLKAERVPNTVREVIDRIKEVQKDLKR